MFVACVIWCLADKHTISILLIKPIKKQTANETSLKSMQYSNCFLVLPPKTNCLFPLSTRIKLTVFKSCLPYRNNLHNQLRKNIMNHKKQRGRKKLDKLLFAGNVSKTWISPSSINIIVKLHQKGCFCAKLLHTTTVASQNAAIDQNVNRINPKCKKT